MVGTIGVVMVGARKFVPSGGRELVVGTGLVMVGGGISRCKGCSAPPDGCCEERERGGYGSVRPDDRGGGDR